MKQCNKNARMEEEHETQAGRSVRKVPAWGPPQGECTWGESEGTATGDMMFAHCRVNNLTKGFSPSQKMFDATETRKISTCRTVQTYQKDLVHGLQMKNLILKNRVT
jgi:hypothetical protein